MLLQAWPLWGHGERRIRNTALSLFPERCSLQPWDGSCLPSHPLAALPPLCSPLTPIPPCAVPRALPVPSLLAPSGLGGCPGRSVQPPSLGRADSPRPKSCSLHPAVTAGPISAPQEGRCRSHTAQIGSDPIQRRSPATQEIQTDTASVTLRAEGSDPGSLSPCQHLGASLGARGTPSLPLDHQLPLAGSPWCSTPGPAVLWPGTPCIPLYSNFTGLWARSSTVWEEGFFQKHENCFTVRSMQRNRGEERAEFPPRSSPKSLILPAKGQKKPKARAVRGELGAATSL